MSFVGEAIEALDQRRAGGGRGGEVQAGIVPDVLAVTPDPHIEVGEVLLHWFASQEGFPWKSCVVITPPSSPAARRTRERSLKRDAVVLSGTLPPFDELASHVLLDAKHRARPRELKIDERAETAARRRHRDIAPRNENGTGADAKQGDNIQVKPRWCCPRDECLPAIPAGPDITRALEGGPLERVCLIELAESPPARDRSDAVADRQPEHDEPDSSERDDAENEAEGCWHAVPSYVCAGSCYPWMMPITRRMGTASRITLFSHA